YAGAGLLKSTDGGSTWTLLGAATFAGAAFSDVRVDPSNPDIVLAATGHGFAGKFDTSPPAIPPTGLLRSTDGGATWSLRLAGEATDLEVHPTNFDQQYAGLGELFGDAANGVYRSLDGGVSWTPVDGPWNGLTGGVGRVEIAIAPSNPSVVYVSIQDALDGA